MKRHGYFIAFLSHVISIHDSESGPQIIKYKSRYYYEQHILKIQKKDKKTDLKESHKFEKTNCVIQKKEQINLDDIRRTSSSKKKEIKNIRKRINKIVKNKEFSIEINGLGEIIFYKEDFKNLTDREKLRAYTSQLIVDSKIRIKHPGVFLSQENQISAKKLIENIIIPEEFSSKNFFKKSTEELKLYAFNDKKRIKVDKNDRNNIRIIHDSVDVNFNDIPYDDYINFPVLVKIIKQLPNERIIGENEQNDDEYNYNKEMGDVDNEPKSKNEMIVALKPCTLTLFNFEIRYLFEEMYNYTVTAKKIIKKISLSSPLDIVSYLKWLDANGIIFPRTFFDSEAKYFITRQPFYLRKKKKFIELESLLSKENITENYDIGDLTQDSHCKRKCERFIKLRKYFSRKNKKIAYLFNLSGKRLMLQDYRYRLN